jgi:hypothetical protein
MNKLCKVDTRSGVACGPRLHTEGAMTDRQLTGREKETVRWVCLVYFGMIAATGLLWLINVGGLRL